MNGPLSVTSFSLFLTCEVVYTRNLLAQAFYWDTMWKNGIACDLCDLIGISATSVCYSEQTTKLVNFSIIVHLGRLKFQI